MTSTARNYKQVPGFTLLEIVIVLTIAAIIIGGAAGLMIYSSDERALRDYSGQIELLAKRARTTAILQQTSYALEFRPGVVRMLPLAQAGADERKKIGGREIGGKIEKTEEEVNRQINLKDGMNISIRRWNTEAWLPTGQNTVHIWRFDPDGLCEPIAVRLSLDKSWSEDTYHPLTATIRDHQFETQ